MEITKEIIDNLPPNIFCSFKERRQIKKFYKELLLLINEKVKKKESLVNIKIFFRIHTKIFTTKIISIR